MKPMEHAIRHSHFKAKIAEWLGIASSGGGPKRPSCRPCAAEKVVRYRHAQLSAIKLAGDTNANNPTLDELVVRVNAELTKLAPLLDLDAIRESHDAENGRPLR